MRNQLKKLDLALKRGIWQLRIWFQNFKERLTELITRKTERDAKRIGKEIAVKKRVGIEDLDLDIRNDDKLIYDIRYQIRDQINNRKPEGERLKYEIKKAQEKSKIRISYKTERNKIINRIIKSDIEKLKSENKKVRLLETADLQKQLQYENNQYSMNLRLLDEQLVDVNLSNEERLKLEDEKVLLTTNHNETVTTLKDRIHHLKHNDDPEIMSKINALYQERADNKVKLDEYISHEKEELSKFVAEKEQRLTEIRENPTSESAPLMVLEPTSTDLVISKKYVPSDEWQEIEHHKVEIKRLDAEFRAINEELLKKERLLREEAKANKDEYVRKYVHNKTKNLSEEIKKVELSHGDPKRLKELRKQYRRVVYVETIEAEHEYQLKTNEKMREETAAIRRQQREIHQEIVQHNRDIRDINDSLYFKEKAHKVQYYTELYSSKSDEEVLKMVPPTKKEQERTESIIDNVKKILKALLYLFPALLLLGVFTFYPIINSFIISFYEGYNIQTGEIDGFTLIGNYQKVLTHSNFVQAIINTGVIVFISVPVTILVGLLIAIALHSIKPLKGFFQTVFFLPYVTNTIAIGLVFAYIFSGNTNTIAAGEATGLANQILKLFGASQVPWLGMGATYWSAMIVILIYGLWNGLAFKIIVFLAGIEGIDKQYYQASQIDGANRAKQFRRITVPLLSPMILYILITSIIGAFKTYTSVVAIVGKTGVITSGRDGPVYLKTIVFYVYDYIEQAGQNGMMSLASAAAIILFAIILVFTAIQLAVSKKRVHY
ncbi:MAG: ABC transporter permease subunit [Acholeplasmataceae bacterium]|jgi:multiple sugar transport system permease protein